MNRLSAFCAAAALVCSAPLANAAVLYSTGFEAPAHSLGDIVGQDGWEDIGEFGASATVQNVFTFQGEQALAVTVGADTDWWWKQLFFDTAANPEKIVEIEWQMRVQSGASQTQFGIDVYDSNVEQIGSLGVGADGYAFMFDNAAGSQIAPFVGFDAWHEFKLVLDFATQTLDAWIDGTEVFSDVAFLTPATTFADADVFASGNAAENNTAYFDNLLIAATNATAVPEPASLGLIGLGAAMLLRRRGR